MSLYLKGTSVYLYHGKSGVLKRDGPVQGLSRGW
jgi:hypothetical protein